MADEKKNPGTTDAADVSKATIADTDTTVAVASDAKEEN
jgi:carbamoyl-phosphate synthase small subunit